MDPGSRSLGRDDRCLYGAHLTYIRAGFIIAMQ
jgi:hypothetical protein